MMLETALLIAGGTQEFLGQLIALLLKAQLGERWHASLAGPGSNTVMSRSESAILRGNPIMLLPLTTFHEQNPINKQMEE